MNNTFLIHFVLISEFRVQINFYPEPNHPQFILRIVELLFFLSLPQIHYTIKERYNKPKVTWALIIFFCAQEIVNNMDSDFCLFCIYHVILKDRNLGIHLKMSPGTMISQLQEPPLSFRIPWLDHSFSWGAWTCGLKSKLTLSVHFLSAKTLSLSICTYP